MTDYGRRLRVDDFDYELPVAAVAQIPAEPRDTSRLLVLDRPASRPGEPALTEGTFDIMIVPYTWEQTNLRARRVGDAVNLECDLIGKYVVRAAEVMARADSGRHK